MSTEININKNIYNSDGTINTNRTVDLDSKELIFDNGSVGINVNPSTALHVNALAVPAGEAVARFGVTDSSGYVQIANGTGTNNVFAPLLQGKQVGTSLHSAIGTEGIIDPVDDIGTTPITLFKARLSSFASPVTRPLFQFTSWSFNIMTMLANGNVGIGTATPGEKLDVNGKTKTTNFQMTTTPTAGYVLTSDASGNGTWSAAAGGLTYFTEAANTTAPNATVPVNSLTATGAATNIDVAIRPKGTGAITLAIADNTSTGGNKRGAGAIDLQLSRTAASQVASATDSVAIGRANTTTGQDAASIGVLNNVGGYGSQALGWQLTVSGAYATGVGNSSIVSGTRGLAFGYNNTSSNDNALCLGGVNTASASASVAIGNRNTASGDGSFAYGYYAHTFGIIGRKSYASGFEGTAGDAQTSKFVLRERTTGNTATTLTTDSATAGTTNQVILSNNSAYRFKGTIIGKQAGSSNVAAWDVDGIIVRGPAAIVTTLSLGNVTLVQNTPAWGTPTLAADTTNGGLRVQVTGATATNIQWTAVIDTTEVIYA